MPKSVKKKAPAKKSRAKKVVKKVTKKASTSVKSKKVAPRASFMWELLKRKEAERARLQEERKNSNFNMRDGVNPQLPVGNQGFSRFAGPRRRAA